MYNDSKVSTKIINVHQKNLCMHRSEMYEITYVINNKQFIYIV